MAEAQEAIRLLAGAIERSKVNVPPPPTFDGSDPGYAIGDFFTLFENYAQAVYGAKSRSWVLALQSFVAGEARDALTAMGITNAEYDTVKERMQASWGARREQEATPQERFLKAEIRPGETLHVYSMRLLRLAGQAFEGIGDLNKVVLPKFMMTLDGDTRKAMEAYMLLMPEPTVETLVPLATTLSASRNGPLPAAVYSVGASAAPSGAVPRMASTDGTAPARATQGGLRGATASTSGCTYCGYRGHGESDCWVKTAQCHSCRDVGHLKYDCPHLRRRGGGRGGGRGRARDRVYEEGSNDRSDTRCAFCGTPGHFMNNCRDFLQTMKSGNE